MVVGENQGGSSKTHGKGLWLGAGLASIALAASLSAMAASMAVGHFRDLNTSVVEGVSQSLADHVAVGETQHVAALIESRDARLEAEERARAEAALARANDAAASVESTPAWPEGSVGDYMRRHIVWGDTLSEIAEEEGTTVRRLAELNGIPNVDLIYAGDWLYIG